MFDRFSERARKSIAFARQEAERFNHDYIGTEHVLLGLIKEGSGTAAHVLEKLGINLDGARIEVEKLIQPSQDVITVGQLPFTPRAKHVLELAIDEARNFNHTYVGTEHLLLGLIREEHGLAAQVLAHLGLELDDVRKEVLNFLGSSKGIDDPEPHKKARSVSKIVDRYMASVTPRLQKGIEMYAHKSMLAASEEAVAQGSDILMSEHILIGLLSVPDGLVAKLLKKHGLEIDAVRAEALKMRHESADSN